MIQRPQNWFLLTLVLALGCGSQPVVDLSDLTLQNYPRVDGSTSAHPLQVVIACHLLGTSHRWEEWYDGTMRAVPESTDPAQQDEVQYIREQIVHHGTHEAWVNLIEGQTDVILVARAPSQDELTLAAQRGVQFQAATVALDAFVFIANVANPVGSLTVSQIQGIYTGQYTNWSQVGGTDAEIHAYQRDANSGSQELMRTLVMPGLQMIDAPDMILVGMMGPINRISEDQLGLGYSVYFYASFMAPTTHLKLIGVDSVVPTYQTIRSRQYRYTTDVLVATRQGLDPQSPAARVARWLQTSAGQQVVQASGYVPVPGG